MRARWMRLDLEPAALKRGCVAVSIQNCGRRFLPVPGALPLLARLDEPCIELSLDPADGRLIELSRPERALASFRRLSGAWKGAELNFPGVAVFPGGSRAESRRYRKHIEAARRHMSAWDGAFLAAHPEIVSGWPFAPAVGRASSEPPRVAVALHLYYTELWDEFETLLGRWSVPFRLFLTLNAPDEALAGRVRAAFPGAEIRVVQNLGRDVRPFLTLLEQGAFEPYALICKLHGKRSLGGGRLPAFGEVLRRANFHDLIADPGRVEALIARFDAAPDLGVIGSARFLSASTAQKPSDVLGKNRTATLSLSTQLGAPLTEPEFDFFEGTMFWARPSAFARLAAQKLSETAFAAEAGRTDGAPEHALERLFNHIARSSGFRVETTIAE